MRNPIYSPGEYYHIYNRANGMDKVFYKKANYEYFLDCYSKKLSPYLSTFAYCLMPNHFHFIVRVKNIKKILEVLPNYLFRNPKLEFSDIISNEIIRKQQGWLGGYAQAINKQESRRGSLFMHTSKRKCIGGLSYLQKVIIYVHQNPCKAGFVHDLNSWEFSSYNEILKEDGIVEHRQIMKIFANREEFIRSHQLNLKSLQLLGL